MSITLTNKPDTAEPFIEYAKSRKGIVTRQFEPGMEEEISRLVKLCIDSSVPNYYEDPEPIKRALAHLYSPENILKKSEGDYPIYVSGPNGKISWVMQLSGVNLTNNTQVDSLSWEQLNPSKEPEVFAQELGMFYGEKSGTGIMSAMDLMVNAKTMAVLTGCRYIVGKGIRPAREFIRGICKHHGKFEMSQNEFDAFELDPLTNQQVKFKVVNYRFIPSTKEVLETYLKGLELD